MSDVIPNSITFNDEITDDENNNIFHFIIFAD
jgi:outer membrane lipoprotein-sorting protein